MLLRATRASRRAPRSRGNRRRTSRCCFPQRPRLPDRGPRQRHRLLDRGPRQRHRLLDRGPRQRHRLLDRGPRQRHRLLDQSSGPAAGSLGSSAAWVRPSRQQPRPRAQAAGPGWPPLARGQRCGRRHGNPGARLLKGRPEVSSYYRARHGILGCPAAAQTTGFTIAPSRRPQRI